MIRLNYYPLPKATAETLYRLYFSGMLRHPNADGWAIPKAKPWRAFLPKRGTA